MGYIKEYIASITMLTQKDWDIIAPCFMKRIFGKKSKLVELGKTEQYLSFIEKGIVRHYIPGEENDLTFGFNFEKEFTCAYDSFLTQKPAEYEQETLTDAILWSISHSSLQKVYSQTRSGDTWGRYAAEKLFLQKSKREIALLKNTATERYRDLLKNDPHIVKEIPLKYIASYIGVTPQALSRIRKTI